MIRLPWRRRTANQPPESSSTEGAASDRRDGLAPEAHADAPDSVRGERGVLLVRGAQSLQSRMSSLLAAGLMISVGAAMLAWYYTKALSRPAAVHGGVRAALPEAPGEGMTLPPPGSFMPPPGPRPVPPGPGSPRMPPPRPLQSATTGPLPVMPAGPVLEPPLTVAVGRVPGSYGAPPQVVPRQALPDRRLSGEVFTVASHGSPSDVASADIAAGRAGPTPGAAANEQPLSNGPRGDSLSNLLRPSVLTATRARVLPTLRLLLTKGTFIDCTLETAVDSTLPGMTTCITAADTFSADGTVVLLERGTKLIGETRGDVRQGEARVFVVWTEARTPAGVVVQLDSPGTDTLGRSGLAGKVDRHFWQRFGAAALVSTIDGVVQSEVQSSSRSGTVVLDPTASEDVLTEILRSTVNIPPTVSVRNGARIQVLVARDVDFRTVYELDPR